MAVAGNAAEHAGELNYNITRIIEGYRADHGDSYETFHDITAALDDAKDEFRRRVVHPYEDIKRRQNGDVYRPLSLS